MSYAPWRREVLLRRVDGRERRRFAAASPDGADLQAYASFVRPVLDLPNSLVVVLGMTPELRELAARMGGRLVSVDSSPDAIRLYGDWLPDGLRARETIECADWLDLAEVLGEPADAILADGAFGNLSRDLQRPMLERIRRVLRPGGVFVTRTALVPRGFRPRDLHWRRLRNKLRRGMIDGNEFGLTARLFGLYGSCYDGRTCTLDNACVVARFRGLHSDGRLSDEEIGFLERFYFEGQTCLLPQTVWEELLGDVGLTWAISPLTGALWRSYYIVYAATRRA